MLKWVLVVVLLVLVTGLLRPDTAKRLRLSQNGNAIACAGLARHPVIAPVTVDGQFPASVPVDDAHLRHRPPHRALHQRLRLGVLAGLGAGRL